jgi:heptosyltransferase III
MPVSPAADPPHVLVIRRRYLGDIVLLSSLLRNLRAHWPNARLVLLCDHAYAGGAALLGELDEVLYFPQRAGEWLKFSFILRRKRFTHVLDCDNRDKTALFTRMTGASVRLTFNRVEHPKFPFRHPWVYTKGVLMSREWYDTHHITEIYHTMLEPLGVPATITTPRFRLRQDDVTEMQRLMGGGAGPKVVVHPGSRSPYRLWPADRFAKVCDRLQEELGAQVFLVGGPAERTMVEEIRRHAASHLVAVDRALSVQQLAALFAQADVLLAHDSGPMHVAAGVGTRIVALYGSQNATIWRPMGEGHIILQTKLPCPCFPPGVLPKPCNRADSYFSYCVRQLEVDPVFAAVARGLKPLTASTNLT